MKNKWQRPNYNDLIITPDDVFRCGDCNEIKKGNEEWEASRCGMVSICDDCKKKREKNAKSIKN